MAPSAPEHPPASIPAALAVAWTQGPYGPTVLVARRKPGRRLAGFWEWPGGKVEPGETPLQAALRELREETAISASAEACQPVCVHLDPGPPCIEFHVFLVRCAHAEPPRATEASDPRWAPLDEALTLHFAPANRAFHHLIAAALKGSPRAASAPHPSALP